MFLKKKNDQPNCVLLLWCASMIHTTVLCMPPIDRCSDQEYAATTKTFTPFAVYQKTNHILISIFHFLFIFFRNLPSCNPTLAGTIVLPSL